MCVIEAYFVQSAEIVIAINNTDSPEGKSLVANTTPSSSDNTEDIPTELISRQLGFWHLKAL